MRNLLLSAALIAVPVAGFALFEAYLVAAAPSAEATAQISAGLGDLSAYSEIVSATQSIAATGDLAAAEKRITDLEVLWDQNAATLRQADPGAWGAIDDAADRTFSALRASTPNPVTVSDALNALAATLAAPVAAPAGTVQQVMGIDVTDATGHPLPCEEMINQVRAQIGTTTPNAAVADLLSRALERCNADDDAHADAFSAQALAQLKG